MHLSLAWSKSNDTVFALSHPCLLVDCIKLEIVETKMLFNANSVCKGECLEIDGVATLINIKDMLLVQVNFGVTSARLVYF